MREQRDRDGMNGTTPDHALDLFPGRKGQFCRPEVGNSSSAAGRQPTSFWHLVPMLPSCEDMNSICNGM